MTQIPPLDWPDDLSAVECVGFSDLLIYDLVVAVDHDRVEFVSHTQNSWYHTYVFDFLGFRYELETERESEDLEVPYRLCKIARLGVDDDGNTVIDEKFPIAMAKLANASRATRYEGDWGTF